MDTISTQILGLAAKADDAGRVKILQAIQDIQRRVEGPKGTLYNFPLRSDLGVPSICLISATVIANARPKHLKIAVIHAGVDLRIFKILSTEPTAISTLSQLADKTGASPNLLERILRYLSSTGNIDYVGPNQFEANQFTPVLLIRWQKPCSVMGIFVTCGPAIQAFPSFLEESKYQDITSNRKTAFQKGFNTELTAFEWMSQNPKQFAALQTVMTALQSNNWLAGFDLLDKAARVFPAGQPDKVFLVDVGGGHGQQAVQLRELYPDLSGHLVLQDISQAVDKLPPIAGIKVEARDFFEKQEVVGTNFYYLRRCLHDWPDDLCLKILKHLVAAMGPESRILIDEVVLPDFGVHWHAAMQDISMAIQLGGKERTRTQWEKLVEQADLRIAEIHTHDISLYYSIIVLEQK